MISYMLLNQSDVGFVSELQQNKTKQENALSLLSQAVFSLGGFLRFLVKL